MVRWFLSRATPVLHGKGRIKRWFGTNTDVTATQKLEEFKAWSSRKSAIA
ncbi:hypothetical protein [Rhizobium sp. BK176]|nr:hypothetical protein [Rhizobium sp. BK176]MCS4096663.1 hypothetical protein [Rhizobium sp. BK176]